jgi:hypothetical protein
MAKMEATYGSGTWCPDRQQPSTCLDIEAITEVMATARDPQRLREVWEGWRTVSIPMRDDYARFVELSNRGARELGFADTGALWRSKYDMPPDAFAREVDRLWEQVRPLYISLHAYVRMKLREKYGEAVAASGPMPAHLLGNIWAQDWSNVGALVAPKAGPPAYSLTGILEQRKVSPVDMVRMGERFFTSLGFSPVPETFWQRSLFVKPADRNVVCHASAWAVDLVGDLRIKMCIDPTEEDFTTIHHELGHNIYQRAYNTLPVLFRDSANDGFHEAVGDTIALSVTPEYLVRIGLLDRALQPGVVGPAAQVSGRRAALAARRGVLRPGCEVSRAGRDAVHALLPRAHPAVPVPSRPGAGRRLHRPAAPLLHIREQGRRGQAERDADARFVQALARRARGVDRQPRDGRDRHPRLLRAAADVARRADQGAADRMVTSGWLARGARSAPLQVLVLD